MKIDQYILLFLLMIMVLALGGCSSAGDDDDSGTIISNPKLESDNIFPDFELAIPETSLLGDSSSSSSLSSLAGLTRGLSSLIIDSTEDVPPIVEGAITTGAKFELDRIRDNMIIAGLEIASSFAASGITITTEFQTFSTDDTTVFVDAASKWNIDIKYDGNGYIYLYFKDQDQGDYRAIYIVKPDNSGNPVEGIFVYVNPASFNGADDEVKSVYLAYDTTDSTDNRLLMRTERAYLSSSGTIPFYSFHDFYQCNTQTGQCLTDHFESDKTDGTVAEDFQVRVGYEESTKIVCLAQLDEESDRSYALVSDTYQYTGPDVPDPSGVTQGGCSLPAPAWSFNSADFISEAEIKVLYGDGTSRDTWDAITSDHIDSALNGADY